MGLNHKLCWAGATEYRDVPGGGGDQDDRPGQEVEGVPGEGEPQGDGRRDQRHGLHRHPDILIKYS